MQVARNPLSVNSLPQPAEEKTSSRKKGGGRKGGKSKGRGQEPDEDTVKSTCGLKFMAPEEVCFVFELYVHVHITMCIYTRHSVCAYLCILGVRICRKCLVP